MKILSPSQIRAADAYTIEHEPIASIDLMERAATECVKAIRKYYDDGVYKKIAVFVGPGNNGGDGLAIARLLHDLKYSVSVYMLTESSALSPDAYINYERLSVAPVVLTEENMPELHRSTLVIDALFGVGLSRPLDGLAAKTVHHINNNDCTVLSIDMPSGLFSEDNAKNNYDNIICANYTLSLQQPKMSFFFAENEKYVGKHTSLHIGILPAAIEKQAPKLFFLESTKIGMLIEPRSKFDHKGDFGHVLLIAGSCGMMGAAVLAAKACLRTGAGKVTAHIPKDGNIIMQIAVPEAMTSLDKNTKCFSKVPDIEKYTAIAVGPGIGTKPKTQRAFFELLRQLEVIKSCKIDFAGKLVLDADALNILSVNRKWLKMLPSDTILTPHPGEFDRLFGACANSYDRCRKQIEMAQKYSVFIVLKGAHTSIAIPNGRCIFNDSGNPGMATAGSGDVLTGMIASLLAQGYPPDVAACAGVDLHGIAGDMAAANSQEALIAGDIVNCIGKAFLELY